MPINTKLSNCSHFTRRFTFRQILQNKSHGFTILLSWSARSSNILSKSSIQFRLNTWTRQFVDMSNWSPFKFQLHFKNCRMPFLLRFSISLRLGRQTKCWLDEIEKKTAATKEFVVVFIIDDISAYLSRKKFVKVFFFGKTLCSGQTRCLAIRPRFKTKTVIGLKYIGTS